MKTSLTIDRAEMSVEEVGAGAARRKKRGPKRFSFTYADIAQVTGLSERTVRADAHERTVKGRKPRPAKFDPADLRSIVRYVMRRGGI